MLAPGMLTIEGGWMASSRDLGLPWSRTEQGRRLSSWPSGTREGAVLGRKNVSNMGMDGRVYKGCSKTRPDASGAAEQRCFNKHSQTWWETKRA
jgi:hypothetical protein